MIDWLSFLVVFAAALISACVVVALFSLALRFNDGEAPWRRPVSRVLFVLCGLCVLFGIVVIVPYFSVLIFGS